jgi:hypothetical protein
VQVGHRHRSRGVGACCPSFPEGDGGDEGVGARRLLRVVVGGCRCWCVVGLRRRWCMVGVGAW